MKIMKREYRIKEKGGEYCPQYKYWATLDRWVCFTKVRINDKGCCIQDPCVFMDLDEALKTITDDKDRISRTYGL